MKIGKMIFWLTALVLAVSVCGGAAAEYYELTLDIGEGGFQAHIDVEAAGKSLLIYSDLFPEQVYWTDPLSDDEIFPAFTVDEQVLSFAVSRWWEMTGHEDGDGLYMGELFDSAGHREKAELRWHDLIALVDYCEPAFQFENPQVGADLISSLRNMMITISREYPALRLQACRYDGGKYLVLTLLQDEDPLMTVSLADQGDARELLLGYAREGKNYYRHYRIQKESDQSYGFVSEICADDRGYGYREASKTGIFAHSEGNLVLSGVKLELNTTGYFGENDVFQTETGISLTGNGKEITQGSLLFAPGGKADEGNTIRAGLEKKEGRISVKDKEILPLDMFSEDMMSGIAQEISIAVFKILPPELIYVVIQNQNP